MLFLRNCNDSYKHKCKKLTVIKIVYVFFLLFFPAEMYKKNQTRDRAFSHPKYLSHSIMNRNKFASYVLFGWTAWPTKFKHVPNCIFSNGMALCRRSIANTQRKQNQMGKRIFSSTYWSFVVGATCYSYLGSLSGQNREGFSGNLPKYIDLRLISPTTKENIPMPPWSNLTQLEDQSKFAGKFESIAAYFIY